MKKILSIILSVLLVLCFASCGADSEYVYTPDEESEREIMKKVENGSMGSFTVTDNEGKEKTVEVVLSEKKDSVMSKLSNVETFDNSNGKLHNIYTGELNFIFSETNADIGLVGIVCFDSPYDFNNGTSTPEDIIKRLDEPKERKEKSGADLWFMPYSNGVKCDCLRYEADNNSLEFYFIDGFLSMTALYVTKEWNG